MEQRAELKESAKTSGAGAGQEKRSSQPLSRKGAGKKKARNIPDREIEALQPDASEDAQPGVMEFGSDDTAAAPAPGAPCPQPEFELDPAKGAYLEAMGVRLGLIQNDPDAWDAAYEKEMATYHALFPPLKPVAAASDADAVADIDLAMMDDLSGAEFDNVFNADFNFAPISFAHAAPVVSATATLEHEVVRVVNMIKALEVPVVCVGEVSTQTKLPRVVRYATVASLAPASTVAEVLSNPVKPVAVEGSVFGTVGSGLFPGQPIIVDADDDADLDFGAVVAVATLSAASSSSKRNRCESDGAVTLPLPAQGAFASAIKRKATLASKKGTSATPTPKKTGTAVPQSPRKPRRREVDDLAPWAFDANPEPWKF